VLDDVAEAAVGLTDSVVDCPVEAKLKNASGLKFELEEEETEELGGVGETDSTVGPAAEGADEGCCWLLEVSVELLGRSMVKVWV